MPFCDACNNITEVFYDIAAVKLHDSGNPYLRFRDLLPVEDIRHLPQTAAYTPLIHAKALGASLGMPRLYLKDETRAPTGTTKDRMAAVSLAYLYECGVRTFCTSSTGNSSTAYANAIAGFPDFSMYLFTAEAFRDRVQYRPCRQIMHFVLRGASFVEAFNYSAEFARKNGFVPERGFFNLGRREGLKLAWFEAIDQLQGRNIDWYVQAISSAMGVYGTYKGAREMMELGRAARMPRLLCVQQESCAPMANAWRDNCEAIEPRHIVSNPCGIAKAILRGDPTRAYPHTRRIVQESRGSIESVSEAEIREARTMVEEMEGVSPCFSASTAIAGLVKRVRRKDFPTHDTVMVNLSGSDRAPVISTELEQDRHWLVRSGTGWTPQDPGRDPGLLF
jgi:threonine synthase